MPWYEKGSEFRELWKLALPLALAQAGQSLMGLVDTAVLGAVSPEAQAGAGLGNSLAFTCSYFGMGVLLALDPMVSQAIGAGQPAKARSSYWQGVWLAILTSLVVMVAIAIIPFTLEFFNVEPGVARGARTFMWWRLPGITALLLFVAVRAYLGSTGRVAATFWAMVFANVANFGLDLVLVFGWGPIPALGVAGAAIATSLCTCLQVVVLWMSLGPAPEGTQRRFDRVEVLKAVKIGIPIGLHMLAESGLFSLAGVLAGALGAVAGAAHQVALNWASLTFCVASGIGSAAATRVGWSVGRGDEAGARRAGWTALASATGFMAFASVFFLAFPYVLARLMSKDETVVATVVQLFFVVAVFQISDGVQSVGAGALRGAGDTTFTFWANILGHWFVGFPVSLLLGVWIAHSVVGVWWGLSAGLTAVAVALVVRFRWISTGSRIRAVVVTPAAQ